MVVSDQLRATVDRLAIFVGDYLCAMDRRPVLEDPVPPVVGVVDLVYSEKAAQGHDVVLADRIDPDRDERDCNSKRGLGRITEQNDRNSGKREHGGCKKSIVIVESRAAKAGRQQKNRNRGGRGPEPVVEVPPLRRRQRPEPAIEWLPNVLRNGPTEDRQQCEDRIFGYP